MNAARTSGRLLQLFPPAWRQRYGVELEALIMESTDGDRVPWRTRLDVAAAGVRERLRAAGLSGDAPPADQARDGSLLVLIAWALFVVAGISVQRFSEHWEAVTPHGDRAVPAYAFETLVVTAAVGAVLVVVGAGVAVPGVRAFLRDGGWDTVRRPAIICSVLTAVAGVATVGLVAWADRLTESQRAGSDTAYAIAFVAWALLVVTCVFAATAVAVRTARRLRWDVVVLRVEAWLALALTAAMGVMTIATTSWWIAVGQSAPWFLAGHPVGQEGSAMAPQLAGSVAVMAAATLVGVAGSWRALHGVAEMARPEATRAGG